MAFVVGGRGRGSQTYRGPCGPGGALKTALQTSLAARLTLLLNARLMLNAMIVAVFPSLIAHLSLAYRTLTSLAYRTLTVRLSR